MCLVPLVARGAPQEKRIMTTPFELPKLTATHKRRIWRLVEALRLGKYKKTTNQLREGNRFCCLGVACDLASKPLKLTWNDGPLFDGARYILPPSAMKYYGFSVDNPYVVLSKDNYADLASVNDGGASFKRIATLIAKTYLAPRKKAK